MSNMLFWVRMLSVHPVQAVPLSRKEFMKPEEEYKCLGVWEKGCSWSRVMGVLVSVAAVFM